MPDRDGRAPRYAWRRLWVSPDDTDGVAVRGFFSADVHAMFARDGRPPARDLGRMEDVRVLLLRGESGAGKSVAMGQEVERLRQAGRLGATADMADGMCDVPGLLASEGGREDLTIFLDGLDVGFARDKEAEAALRRALTVLAGAPGARLRLALRTGFAAERLAACLAEGFGGDFEHLTLAPLRAEDARTAAVAEGIDPDRFLETLEVLRVAPLAARPPTLRMLLRLWSIDGRLPTGRPELYRQGCETLLREANPSRLAEGGGDDPVYAGRLIPAERFEIAARLAAFMTFGGHDRIGMGAEPPGTGLHVDAAIGSGDAFPGGPRRMTRRDVREVVGTALFRPAGPDGFAFSHPSFMRFLAAVFVAESGIGPAQGMPLLMSPDGRIGANRIEPVSWLAALAPAYFEHLADTDPQVLLRAGIPAAADRQRLRLAKSLLALSADGGLDLDELSATGDLVLVASAGLEEALAGILRDKGEPPARREFAATLARDADCVPVAACAALALDRSEPPDLRSAALAALNLDDDAAKGAVLALSAADAPDERLHPLALTIAMRRFLSPAEVIQRLKPCGRDAIESSLCLRLLDGVDAVTLPDALLAVVHAAVRSDGTSRHWNHLLVAQGLARRALVHLGDDKVLEAFAAFVTAMPPREPWLRWSFPLQKCGLPPAASCGRRRDLVVAAIRHAAGDVAAVRNLLEGCFLVHDCDLPWIAGKARQSIGGADAPAWSTLAVELVLGFGGTPHDHLRAEGATFAEIVEIARASVDLPSDYERWRPPRECDAWMEASASEREPEAGYGDTEPIFDALDDWKLLTIQTEAGGRSDAIPVTPRVVMALAADADRRLVNDGRDLLRVVRDSLDRLQARLKGRDPLVRALWDEGDKTRPKEENFLSDFIADHLRGDLAGRGVVADREVQIRPRLRDTPGERTDIRVQAFTNPGDGRRQVASLTIEVKGCWHKELRSAMQTQLVDRYLASTGEKVGLYLVAWYVCPAWDGGSVAGAAPGPVTIDSLRMALDAQARDLSSSARRIESALIDATLA